MSIDLKAEQMEASQDGATMQIYKTAKRARIAAEEAERRLQHELRRRRLGGMAGIGRTQMGDNEQA